MFYYTSQNKRESLLLREENKHFSSVIRSVARGGPIQSLWAFLSWGQAADHMWQHGPVPWGFLFRKAALGSGKGLCIGGTL